MGTVIAIETEGGAAIAGDTRETRGDTVTGDAARRVFDLVDVGTGAVGEVGDVQEFRRRLDAELRERELEADVDPRIDWIARAAAEIAEATGVEAVVAARDEDGVARVRRVGPDGSVLEGPTVALGSGAPVAMGRLEGADLDIDLDATEALAREVVETAAERDTETGGDVDVLTRASVGEDDAAPGES